MTSFKEFQKKIFFSKTDIPLLYGKKIDEIPQKAAISSIKSICNTIFHSLPTLVQQFSQSTLHDVYKIIVDDQEYVIRLSRLNDLYIDYFLKVEQGIITHLREFNIPTAEIILTDLSRKIVPYDYQISRYVEGESLYMLSQQKSLSSQYYFQLGQIIARLHSIQTKGYGAFTISSFQKKPLKGLYNHWRDYVICNIEKHIDYCKTNNIVDSNTQQKLQEIFLSRKYIADPTSPSLLHGDIANHNVLFHKGKIAALIDWEDAISGDPIYDISFYGTGIYKQIKLFNSFLEGYRKINRLKLNKDYKSRYWFYFVRIAIFKAVIRHMHGTQTKKGAPEISERIIFGLSNLK